MPSPRRYPCNDRKSIRNSDHELPAMLPRALLAACVATGLLFPAYGQLIRPGRDMRAGKGVKPKLEPFAAEGRIRAVIPGRMKMPGRIQILTDSTQNWLVLVDPKTIVRVVGTAEPDFLRAGMFIRFTAEVDNRGMAKEKLKQLTIFTPSQQNFPGIWLEGQGPADDKPAEGERRFGTGIGGVPPVGHANASPNGRAAGKAPTSGVYSIAGQITRSRKDRLTVNAGRAAVRVQLAEDPKIDVDFADYSVAKPGDRISVTKGKMFAGRIGLAQAQELTIKLSKPLSLAKNKPVRPKPPPKKRPRRQPQKVDPQKEPLGEQK